MRRFTPAVHGGILSPKEIGKRDLAARPRHGRGRHPRRPRRLYDLGQHSLSRRPHGDDDLHKHGSLFIEVDGETVDFDRDRYSQEKSEEVSDDFHFHGDNEDHRFHMHRQRFTLDDALETLPGLSRDVVDGTDVLTVEGETYADDEDATTTATEREEGEIEIGSHALQDGDTVEITAETEWRP